MARGVTKRAVPYILESDRNIPESEQTVWYIKPKKGHDANVTLQRYAAAGRDGRKGYRELNVSRLDEADVMEFLDAVEKVENFHFSEDYPDLHKNGWIPLIADETTLKMVCRDLASDALVEIFEAANNLSHLKAGEKKTPALNVLRVVEERKKGEKQ